VSEQREKTPIGWTLMSGYLPSHRLVLGLPPSDPLTGFLGWHEYNQKRTQGPRVGQTSLRKAPPASQGRFTLRRCHSVSRLRRQKCVCVLGQGDGVYTPRSAPQTAGSSPGSIINLGNSGQGTFFSSLGLSFPRYETKENVPIYNRDGNTLYQCQASNPHRVIGGCSRLFPGSCFYRNREMIKHPGFLATVWAGGLPGLHCHQGPL
jgi:hypothetical protein